MKSFDIRWITTLSTLILALNSYAGDEDSKKAIIPPETPAPSRWSVSAGAATSSIKATFAANPALVSLIDPPNGIYTGGAEQVYANGVVGIGGPANPGPGETGFSGGKRTALNADISTETFYGVNAPPPGSVSDTELSLGGYLKMAYDAFDFDSDTLHLSPSVQYTFTTAFNSGDVPFPATLNTVTYVTTTAGALGGFLRYPPSTVFGVAYPNETVSAPYPAAAVHSSVNIYMHTFTLGFDLTKDLTDRLHLVCTTGPTANLFETGFVSTPVGFPLGVPIRSDSSTWSFGWVGQLGLQLDLDSNKKWFLEGSGNYHWVTPFTVSTALSSARIQASSWGAELGLGYRF
jgi:hypothetical protein